MRQARAVRLLARPRRQPDQFGDEMCIGAHWAPMSTTASGVRGHLLALSLRADDRKSAADLVADEAAEAHGEEDHGIVQDVRERYIAWRKLQVLLQPGRKHGDHGVVDQELSGHPERRRECVPQVWRPEDFEL